MSGMQVRRLLRWRVTRVAATGLHGPYAVVQLAGVVIGSSQGAPNAQQPIHASETVLVPLDSLDDDLYPDLWIVTRAVAQSVHTWRGMP